MNETSRLLEQMADRSNEARLAPPTALRERGAQLTRRRQARWGAGVALVAVAVTIWAVATRPPTHPQPVKPPQGVALPQRVTSPQGSATWSAQLPGRGGFWVRAVAYHDGTWLALGETHDKKHSLGWVSHDGHRWSAEDVPEGLGHRIDSVTDTPNGFAAVGSIGRQQMVWTSADGKTWGPPARLPWPQQTGRMYANQPYATSQGLFVIGGADGYGSYLWRSTDQGRHWKAVDDVDIFRDDRGCQNKPAYAELLFWVSERDGTLIAGGGCVLWKTGEQRLVLTYTSSDGDHWTETSRRYRDDGEPVIWGHWTGPMLSTRDAQHYARAHDHGQIDVWQTPAP